MCWSCKYPGRDNYSSADPKTVMYVYQILPGEAKAQRANLEAIKKDYHGQLCPKHLENFEAVVIALEKYEA